MPALFGEEIENLKNYLASIKHNATYIGDEMKLPQDVRDALREINSAVTKSTRILDKAYRR